MAGVAQISSVETQLLEVMVVSATWLFEWWNKWRSRLLRQTFIKPLYISSLSLSLSPSLSLSLSLPLSFSPSLSKSSTFHTPLTKVIQTAPAWRADGRLLLAVFRLALAFPMLHWSHCQLGSESAAREGWLIKIDSPQPPFSPPQSTSTSSLFKDGRSLQIFPFSNNLEAFQAQICFVPLYCFLSSLALVWNAVPSLKLDGWPDGSHCQPRAEALLWNSVLS